MDVTRFWAVIEASRVEGGDSEDRRVAALRRALDACSPDDLESFQRHYDDCIHRACRWDLWGAAYVMKGGCSDDGFRYFRDWLVSEGRETFERALADPDSLAALGVVDDPENELYGYVALDLHAGKGDGPMRRSSRRDDEPTGERWDEDDLVTRFPKLSALYAN